MKWKKGLFALSTLLVSVIGFGGIEAEAEETVPQIKIVESTISGIEMSGLQFEISIEGYELTAEDFENYSDDTPIVAGKVVLYPVEEDTYLLRKKDEISVDLDMGPDDDILSVTEGEIYFNWDYEYSELEDYRIFTDKTDNEMLKYWPFYLEWNDKEYKLGFEVIWDIPPSYIVSKIKSDQANISRLITVQNWNVNYYGVSVENNTYTISPNTSKYYQALEPGFKFEPRYAYGASGVGADKNGYFTTDNRVYTDNGYPFTITNIKGEQQIFYLKVDMPWRFMVSGSCSDYVKTVKDNDTIKNNDYDDASGKGYSLTAGSKITVSVTPPDGKVLKKVTLVDASGNEVSNEVSEDSKIFTFDMPNSVVTLTGLEFEEDTSNYKNINVSVKMIGNDEETVAGTVKVKKAGNEVSSAGAGQQITLEAISTEGTGLYNYEFDHWETDSISDIDLSEQSSIQFIMPDQDVDVTAYFKHCGKGVTVGITSENAGRIRLSGSGAYLHTSAAELTDLYRSGVTYTINLRGKTDSDNYPNFETYRFCGWKKADGTYWDTSSNEHGITWNTFNNGTIQYQYPTFTLSEESNALTFIADFEAKRACSLTVMTEDVSKGTVSAKSEDDETFVSGNILYDGDTLKLTAEPKTGYLFDSWKTEPSAGVEFTDASSAETTCTLTKDIGSQVTITATFKVDPNYKSNACDMTKVELLKSDGTLIKVANRDGKTFTIQLSAEDMTLSEANMLASGGYKLRITTSDKSLVAMEGGFADDSTATWREGVSNPISKGGEKTFTVTAEDGTTTQSYTIAIQYDDKPVLTAGTVERTSDTEATVEFLSSSTGMYYYGIVDEGAAAPEISTSGVGVNIKSVNTAVKISLSTLTAGAKDIYIVVKNDDKADAVKISDALKITIPDFDPNAKRYTITVTSAPGGTVTVDKNEAKEGETVKVTVTPDSGKQMIAGTLKFSWDQAPYTVQSIDESKMTFTMPASSGSISCRFEDASSGNTGSKTVISAFQINGVSATINDTTGIITVTLPNGTDLTSLSPVIVLGDGVKSISPASGKSVDLSKAVTYTVTMEDGTTKTYTVTAYTEAPPKSEELWEDMLNSMGGSTSSSGKKTWWQKAKDFKKNNDYPIYW